MGTRIMLAVLLTLGLSEIHAQDSMMVRIAEIDIHPEYFNEYKNILREEAAASIKNERGVIAIFPMQTQRTPNQIRIVEIYASKEAYESHLKSPHFQHYKIATQKMVKALNLVDMEALDKQAMLQIFKKLQ